MAASTQTKTTPSLDGLFERTTHAQDQFTTAARKAAGAYLDSYDKAVDRTIELELRLAESTRTDWIKSMVETQTEFARELTHTYSSTARTLLR
jgi:transketolase